MQLAVTETSLRARTIGSLLRTYDAEGEWQTVSLDGFDMDWPKKSIGVDEVQLYPKFTIRNKTALNRVLAASRESLRVYIATDDSPAGEALALHLKRQIIAEQPDKTVRRMRLSELTASSLERAIRVDLGVDNDRADARFAEQVLDRLLSYHLGKAIGHRIGRAMLPALRILLSEYKSNEDYGCVVARFSAGMFGDSMIEFVSDKISEEKCSAVIDTLNEHHPKTFAREVDDDLIAHPPKPFSTSTLLAVATAEMRAKGADLVNQARQLYDAGLLTQPIGAGFGMDDAFVASVHMKIKNLAGASFCGQCLPLLDRDTPECVRPTDISRDPSMIPKPARTLYRLIWGRSLAACSIHAKVRHERVSFEIDGVTFRAEGLKVVEPGYDRVGMGMFLRSQDIPDDLSFQNANVLYDTWPVEGDLISSICDRMDVDSPASVIKALENNSYIHYSGMRITPTALGIDVAKAVDRIVPELASPEFFKQVKYRLAQIEAGKFPRHAVLEEYQAWINERAEYARAVKGR